MMMNKKILIKYINNKCSDEEFEDFAKWIESQKKDEKRWRLISEHWRNFESWYEKKDEKKYSALLDRIHHKINLQNRKNTNSKVIIISRAARWFSRAAAVLFIPLLTILFYLLSNSNFRMDKFTDVSADSIEVIAPIGSRTIVQLTDGTKVNLNYGSRIKYPQNFKGNTREITLSGEGYFDVAHNPDKPFIVKAGKLNIKALGTEFNVHAYPEDDIITTTLIKGKVIIDKKLHDNKIEHIVSMVPDQHITYNLTSDKVVSQMGSVDKYIAWKDGRMIFDNSSITFIAKELSRKFNVDIEVADNIKELTYTVTFVNDPLYLILDLMTETAPIYYKRFPRIRHFDNTFSKQKIRIEKRK